MSHQTSAPTHRRRHRPSQPVQASSAAATAARPRNLENRSDPAVKCYRNVLLVLLFSTLPFLDDIDRKHRLQCPWECNTELCELCLFRDLATRFTAPDEDRMLDTGFDADVDRLWKGAMHGPWSFDTQNDPVEYMDRLLSYFEQACGAAWIRDLIYPKSTALKECQTCSARTKEPAPVQNVSLEMPAKDAPSISLEGVVATRYPPNSAAASSIRTRCDRCKDLTLHTWAEPLVFAPPVLPIQISPALKDHNGVYYRGSLKSLEQIITVSSHAEPLEERGQLPDYTFYRLYGVILHAGHAGFGHYVCAVEGADGGWLLFNDMELADESQPDTSPPSQRITLQELEEMQQGDEWQAYLLAYEKMFSLPPDRSSHSRAKRRLDESDDFEPAKGKESMNM